MSKRTHEGLHLSQRSKPRISPSACATIALDSLTVLEDFKIGSTLQPRLVWTTAYGGRLELRWKMEDEDESSIFFTFGEILEVMVGQLNKKDDWAIVADIECLFLRL
jgi:hypothetical protein